MGVGKQLGRETLADFVLAPFQSEETALLEGFLKQGVAVVSSLLSAPAAEVMNRVNAWLPPSSQSSSDSPNESLQG
jgi:peptidyl-tRNA hydrolase